MGMSREGRMAASQNTMQNCKLQISYKPLFKQLIDKGLKKKDLCAIAGISPATMTKMGKSGYVTTEVLLRICVALDCKLGDIIEVI